MMKTNKLLCATIGIEEYSNKINYIKITKKVLQLKTIEMILKIIKKCLSLRKMTTNFIQIHILQLQNTHQIHKSLILTITTKKKGILIRLIGIKSKIIGILIKKIT